MRFSRDAVFVPPILCIMVTAMPAMPRLGARKSRSCDDDKRRVLPIALTERQCRAPMMRRNTAGHMQRIDVTICRPDLDIAAHWAALVQRTPANVFMNP